MLEGMTPPRNRAIYCKVADLAETLEPKDKEIFTSAINNSELWGANTLANALRQRGLSIADTTITRHRSRICACFRDKLS